MKSEIQIDETRFYIQKIRTEKGVNFHSIVIPDIPTYEQAKEMLNEVIKAEPTAYIFQGTRRA